MCLSTSPLPRKYWLTWDHRRGHRTMRWVRLPKVNLMVTEGFVVGQRPSRLSTAAHWLLSTQWYSLALAFQPPPFLWLSGAADCWRKGSVQPLSLPAWGHLLAGWLGGVLVLKAQTFFLLSVVHYYSVPSLLTQHKGFIFQSEDS